MTDLTAYTLPKGEIQTGIGLVGTDIDNLAADVPFDVGLPWGLQVGTNLAHNAITLFNADVKANLLDTDHFGLGVSAGVKWFNPSNLYVLPQDVRDELGDVNLIIVPVWLETSYPISTWIDAHLGLGYQHSAASGTVSEGSALAQGAIATRELAVHPRVGFYPGDKVALFLGANLPLRSNAIASVSARAELQPGVVAGVDDTLYKRISPRDIYTVYGAGDINWGATHLRMSLVYGLRLFTERVPVPLPALDLYWRF